MGRNRSESRRVRVVGREAPSTRTVQDGLDAYETESVGSVATLTPGSADAVIAVAPAIDHPLESVVREIQRIHGWTPVVVAADEVPEPTVDAVVEIDSAAVERTMKEVLADASLERTRRRRHWTETAIAEIEEATPEAVCERLVETGVYETAWVVERDGEELTPTAAAGVPLAALRAIPAESNTPWARALRSGETVIDGEPPMAAVPAGERCLVCTATSSIDEAAVEPLERHLQDLSATARDDRPKYALFGEALTHEINNHLDLAMLHLENAEEGEHIDHVETALERIDEVTDEVGALVGQNLSVESRTMATVAADVWDGVSVPSADLKVEGGTVEADERLFRLVLSNLFRNAVQHGGDEVTVTAGPLSDGGFYVEDDGPGLPEDTEKAFEWGWSGDDGTGIGLALVSLAAERHGWEIVSESDDGARFEFRP